MVPSTRLGKVEHFHICGHPDTYCGHPRQCGLHNFGNGHLALLHWHAPCDYRVVEQTGHSPPFGYHARAQILLQRSFDGGQTWPAEHNVVVWDEAASLGERQARLFPLDPKRDEMAMSQPGAIFFFGRSWCGESGSVVCFALRSSDQGYHWEKTPTIIPPPAGRTGVHADNHPPVRMPDGSFLKVMSMGPPGAVGLYGSDDDGLTWYYLAEVGRDATGLGRLTYANLLRLPSGRLQCYMLNIEGSCNAIVMSQSNDGYVWSPPRPIVRWGASPWRGHRQPGDVASSPGYPFYRSPWPLLLEDDRLLVLFARRRPPYGIGAIISQDEGQTWSEELILRDDGASPDLGYPVATQLDNDTVFTAYYFITDPCGPAGGPRFIAGSRFRVEG